jgi:PKD repeat protein
MSLRGHNNGNQPLDDIRKQSFIAQNKSLTPPYPLWVADIPNGLYKVRLVSGDRTATDSTFQQDVNGVDTTSVTPGGPGGGVFFAEWTILCRVTNNFLVLTPISTNNDKICYIDVYPGTLPTALFTLGPTNGTAALTVNFTNSSTGDYSSGLWTFGDGGTSTSTNGTVSYTYTNAGTYTVSLTVSNSLGDFSTLTLNNAVTVSPGTPPIIALTTTGSGSSLALQLAWLNGGLLLQSTNLTGPWTTNVGATSPFIVSPTNGQMFFRVKQ